jgi:hypothetical protein
VTVIFALFLAGDEKDGFGDALAIGLLFLVVAGTAACILTVLPIGMALRHGWRWTAAVTALTVACGLPLRIMFQADDPAGASWGLISFPLWLVLAKLARRGPPESVGVLRSRHEDRAQLPDGAGDC